MACPALPLCGLAISEAERGLPDVNLRAGKGCCRETVQHHKAFLKYEVLVGEGCAILVWENYFIDVGILQTSPLQDETSYLAV